MQSVRNTARQIRDGERTVADVADTILESRRRNEHFRNVYQTFDEAEIRRQSDALTARQATHPLTAVPISVKDAFGVNGFPTYGGTKTRLGERWERDTGIVKVLRECGALFSGKTQMVELALGGLGQNPNWGAPVNPWDAEHERVCGGSSCGAGVSLYDGTALIALAADIAGSVRVPASMSGVVGFRPTQGTWPFGESYLGICPTLDSPGILTLSVDDAAFVYDSLSAQTPADGSGVTEQTTLDGVTVGFLKAHFESVQTDIGTVAWDAMKELEDAGATLIEVSFPEYQQAYDFYFESAIAAIECAAFVEQAFPGMDIISDPLIRKRLDAVKSISASDYRKSLNRRRHLIEKAGEQMSAFDVLVTPTLPLSPPLFSELEDPETYARINKSITHMTNPVNVLNLSSLTLPVGKDALGLPVGLQIVGRPHGDATVLNVALRVEKVLGRPLDVLGRPPRLPGE